MQGLVGQRLALRGLGRTPVRLARIALGLLLAASLVVAVEATSGIVTLLSIGTVVTTLVLLVKELGELVLQGCGFDVRLGLLARLALTTASVTVGFAGIEAFLAIDAWSRAPGGGVGGKASVPLTIPTEWEKRTVEVPGANWAYYWHGKLHVHNAEGMRRATPFPPKKAGVCRIMVVGDSLTYGEGVAAEDNYCAVVERSLQTTHAVEVLNLGACGLQSEDILDKIKRYVPQLEPDLVVYGVCLNDFLPSGTGQYSSRGFELFDYPFKDHLYRETRIGKLLTKKYDDLMMRVGLRCDFFDDILSNFDGYQTRFARDVLEANQFVTARGLPPVVTMVLHQFPIIGDKGWYIALKAEEYLNDAGMTVISAVPYIRANQGEQLHVSQWEPHPNELAHRLFADEFSRTIRDLPALERFAKAKN
jgi:hypothetical protein